MDLDALRVFCTLMLAGVADTGESGGRAEAQNGAVQPQPRDARGRQKPQEATPPEPWLHPEHLEQ